VRHSPRSSIKLGIKTLYEEHFVGRQVGLVEPPLCPVSLAPMKRYT
jgi:hypothetical protein